MTDKDTQGTNHKSTTIKYHLKKIKTINDLFAQDDVNRLIEDVNAKKSNINELIAIYKTVDGKIHWECATSNLSTTLGLIEIAKDMMLKCGDEEE
jgi:hypothetical protein